MTFLEPQYQKKEGGTVFLLQSSPIHWINYKAISDWKNDCSAAREQGKGIHPLLCQRVNVNCWIRVKFVPK